MPTREPLATRKNAMLTLSAFLVICTAWWYSQQPGSPPPPPPPGDTTVVVQPPDTTTPPVACSLTGGSGLIGSSTCQPCGYTPPGPTYASISASCVAPPVNTCNLIGGSGDIGSGTCQPCGYNPPGASYATTAPECVAPPAPVPCNLFYGSGTVGSSTCQPCPYNPPGQSYATQAPTCQPPAVPPDTTPTPINNGPATIAELPRAEPAVVYPVGLTVQVSVPSGGNLQAAIDAASPGTEILLEPGGTYTCNCILPNKGAGTNWIVIRTNVSQVPLTTKMTPSLAVTKNLATIQTNNTTAVIATAPGAHHYWLDHVKIYGNTGFSGGNALVKFGDSGGNGQTTAASVPHHLAIVRSLVTVNSVVNVRRNVLMNAAQLLFVSSSFTECHDPGGDSQCFLGYNSTKEVLIQNSTLQGAHEIMMLGGADPADSTMIPQDVTLRGNYIYRPASWKPAAPGTSVYGPGQWPVKNWLETKDGIRVLIENNIIENDWSDAQQYGFNFKSENQDGSAPYSRTSDLTMRYNRIRNTGNGWSLSGKQGSNPAVTMSRIYIHDNWIESGFNVDPYTAEGSITQMLNGIQDMIFAHNTIRNSGSSLGIIKMAGVGLIRMSVHSNAMYHGDYGVKGDGQATGTNTLNTYAPSGLYSHNIMVGGSCGSYPAGNICPSSWPTVSSAGYDGRAIGADTVGIKNRTAAVVTTQ